jgi:hypothetical protein
MFIFTPLRPFQHLNLIGQEANTMNILNFIKASILSAGFPLLPLAHAADVRVLVYGEHSGTDIVYHYTLVNNGTGKMMDLHLGVKEIGPGYEGAHMTLTRLPTGTTWRANPEIRFPEMDLPVPNSASVTSPAQPAGWSVRIGGFRSSEVYAILWKAPQPVYGGPVNVTGADAGQTLSGFTVHVPVTSATGSGAVGSAEQYVSGDFMVRVWLGESWIGKKEQQTFAPIEKQDITPPALSVSVNPATLWPPNNKLMPVTITVSAKDDYDPQPEIKLESITANEVLASGDIQDAALGTDDRSFSLMATRLGTSTAGRIYSITYSATDGTGNKSTATTTVTVPHDQGK